MIDLEAPAIPRSALISPRGGRSLWLCPQCRHILGELTNGGCVIRHGRRKVSIPMPAGVVQACPHCNSASRLERH